MSVNKTTFPTQELRAHKAPMSRYTGSSVGSLAQAPWPEQPAFSAHALPLPTPPYQGSLCSWGCWGWSPIPGLWLLRRQRLKDEFRSARKKRGLKADDKRGLWALLWDRERKLSKPSSYTDWLWVPGQVPAPLWALLSSSVG